MITRAFLTSGFWVTTRYVFIAISGIIVTLGFARLTTKEILGQYQFILSLLALFSVFTLPGLNMAAIKAVSEKKPGGVLEAVERSFRSSLYALPLLLIYAIYLIGVGDRLLGVTLVAASLIFPFFYAPNTWYTYYEGRADFRPVAIRTVIASFTVTAAVLLGLILRLNLFWIVSIYLVVSSLFSLLFLTQVRRAILKASKALHQAGLDLPYGRRVTAQKFVYTLSESLPPLAVSFLLGHASLAGFQVANVFLNGISGLIGSLAVISLPKFFAEADSDHRTILGQNAVIGLLASLGYFITVRIIFLPMYGESYQESFVLAQSLAGLPFVVSLRTFLVNYFTARDKNSFIILVYLIANAVALACFTIATRQTSFVTASGVYLYTLNALLFLPLILAYFFPDLVPMKFLKVSGEEIRAKDGKGVER